MEEYQRALKALQNAEHKFEAYEVSELKTLIDHIWNEKLTKAELDAAFKTIRLHINDFTNGEIILRIFEKSAKEINDDMKDWATTTVAWGLEKIKK